MTISKPLLKLTETANDRIRIMAEFPKLDPSLLFDYWTKPDLLLKWWPPMAELEPRVGGSYHLSWPKQTWHLRGKFTVFDRGRKLAFTWKWDHETVDETRVTLSIERLAGGGSRLTLDHEGYAKSADAKKIRNEHTEGWMFFLGKLQEQV